SGRWSVSDDHRGSWAWAPPARDIKADPSRSPRLLDADAEDELPLLDAGLPGLADDDAVDRRRHGGARIVDPIEVMEAADQVPLLDPGAAADDLLVVPVEEGRDVALGVDDRGALLGAVG